MKTIVLASATAVAFVRRNATKLGLACLALVFSVLSALPASAQTPAAGSVTYGLGQNGAPAAADYFNAANGFSSSIGPILTGLLPVMLLMLGIWQGPRIIKSLVTRFSR